MFELLGCDVVKFCFSLTMKNFLRLSTLLLLLLLLGAPAFGQQRIATIDMTKVFDNYWKTKQAKVALDEQKGDMEKEYKSMGQDLKKAKDDYQALVADANNQALSSEERDSRKKSAEGKLKSIRDLEDAITQYERNATTRLREQGQRMISNLANEIRSIITAKAKSARYDLVLDTSTQGTTTPTVLFSTKESDVTDEIINQLNATAPADISATSDKKGDTKKGDAKKNDKK